MKCICVRVYFSVSVCVCLCVFVFVCVYCCRVELCIEDGFACVDLKVLQVRGVSRPRAVRPSRVRLAAQNGRHLQAPRPVLRPLAFRRRPNPACPVRLCHPHRQWRRRQVGDMEFGPAIAAWWRRMGIELCVDGKQDWVHLWADGIDGRSCQLQAAIEVPW